MKKIFVILVIVFFSSTLFAQNRGKDFGQYKERTGEAIEFKIFRNNVWGEDFRVNLNGTCVYDDDSLLDNTFTIGGGDFPDLLLTRRLKINGEFEVTANSSHRGTFDITCQMSKINNRLARATCNVGFFSPRVPEISLDHCVARTRFRRIVRRRAG